jgi:hypothetical protein
MKTRKYPTWEAVIRALDELRDQLTDFDEHVPLGVSPRKFRSELERARRALGRACNIASARADEDELRERRAKLSKQRADGIPEIAKRLPARLRPGRKDYWGLR